MTMGVSQSPVVDRTLGKRRSIQGNKTTLLWGLLNVVMACAVYTDMQREGLASALNINASVVWYAEVVLLAVFALNAFLNFMRYFIARISSSAIELSVMQKKLLGVKESEAGFRTASPHAGQASPTPGLQLSHSCYTPPRGVSFSGLSTPSTTRHSPPRSSPHSPPGSPYTPTQSPGELGSRTPSPGGYSPAQGAYSPGGYGSSPSSSSSFLGASFLDQSTGAGNLSTSFNRSIVSSPLSTTNTLSPLFRDGADSGLRARLNVMSPRSSPLSPDGCISDLRAYGSFLKEQEERDMKSQLSSPDQTNSGGPSFWSYSRSYADYTPILRRAQYQVACRSPTAAKSRDTEDESTTYGGEEVWGKFDVHIEQVEGWIENVRKWLCGTILVRLVREMNQINRILERIGSEDLRIGEVSISTLKQVAATKSHYVPSLNKVIPYLEVSTNQEYLVTRIKDLASGGSMSHYRWNGGGDYKGKPWGEHLPTDSAIVMHLFCTYMDSRLPRHPKYPDGKTFTTQHFLRSPDKPDLTKKDNLYIYFCRENPPMYKVVLEDDIYNVPKGRSNMFQAILLFLYRVKAKDHGMLGRVNLGLSGVNILWVLNPPPAVTLTSTQKRTTSSIQDTTNTGSPTTGTGPVTRSQKIGL